MEGNSKHQVIQRLQTDLPRGLPLDLTTLAQFGVSPQFAAYRQPEIQKRWPSQMTDGTLSSLKPHR